MTDGYIQLPADDVGKKLDTSDVNMGAGSTSLHRERMVVADPSSTGGFAAVTSSGGLATTVTNTVRSLSSGTVTLSSATSLSSGIVTLSSNPTVAISSGLVSLTSGTVTLSSAAALSSGLVTLSSQHTVALSSGLVSVTSGTITSTAATNPWSSAPTFNVPLVSASSGRIQLAGINTPFRLIVGTSAAAISTAPGTLHALVALSTAAALAGAYMRLYNLTTNNATSSSNAGLAGAKALLRISSSVAGMPGEESYYWPQGIYFDTACSYDLVVAATSTAAQIASWVTAQYTSSE